MIGKAVDLLSGPGGLACFLRRRQLGARLGGPSLPLDIGYSETIPAGIRNAVTLRDKHCQWAGRCDQPAEACQVHHTRHKADGGPTSVKDCVLLVLVPPPGRDPPLGLDPGPEPRRHHHRLEQGQDQGAPQPRPPGPPGVTTPGRSAPLEATDAEGSTPGLLPLFLRLAHVRGRVLVHGGDPGEVPRFVGGKCDRELMAALQTR